MAAMIYRKMKRKLKVLSFLTLDHRIMLKKLLPDNQGKSRENAHTVQGAKGAAPYVMIAD